VLLVKEWLKKNITRYQLAGNKPKGYHGHNDKEIGGGQISKFLSSEGKTISESKVRQLLRMHNVLDEEILKKTTKFQTGAEVGEEEI